MTPDRRTFLKQAAGAAAAGGALGIPGCAPQSDGTSRSALQPDLLRAVAEVVLPVQALGPDGTERAVFEFASWVDGFEPVAELDHPYLTDELRYAPAHPGPRWQADLEALELEAQHRSESTFAALDPPERTALVARAIGDDGEPDGSLPTPARARHVAVGLLAWFYRTSRANDLCYEAHIGRHDCRGIASLPERPSRLEQGA